MFPSLRWISILSTTLALLYTTAWADRPPWAGGSNHRGSYWEGEYRGHEGRRDSHRSHEKRKYSQPSLHQPGHFTVYQTNIVRNYYTNAYRHNRRCPPGLAKLGNGCVPPGHAKVWMVGYPLPGSVIYEPLPSSLRLQLGPPGPGYQFVRVAGDILKIAIGSNLVIDAIQDLGR